MKDQKDFILKTLEDIIKIDSPSGFCHYVTKKVAEITKNLGYEAKISNKGSIEINIKGKSNQKKVGIAAHLDTLGAQICAINGKEIKFTQIGGLNLATIDGEYCRIYTRDGKIYTGTFLHQHASSHVFNDAATAPREAKNMYIRLDEKIKSAYDIKALGIQIGDFIALDPKFVVTQSGYVKSRFLDDKASVAIILGVLNTLSQEKCQPLYDTKVIFTTYEEVGHGASPFGEGLDEVLAVDMGCVGGELSCTEHDVSICAKDSSGPYDYEFTTRLINLAKKHELSYAVDIYPYYGSDVSAMLRAGRDIKGGLIGAGIHASHGMERTHIDGLINTYKLLLAYLTE